jgi:TPR repeat protein
MPMVKKTWLVMAFMLLLPVIGAAQDEASLEQLRQAATAGNAEAQLEIGILYEFGYNMPKNDVTALAWYLQAADHGNVLAVARRDQLKSKMKPQDIEAAEKMSAGLVPNKSENAPAPAPPPATPAPAEPAKEAPPSSTP